MILRYIECDRTKKKTKDFFYFLTIVIFIQLYYPSNFSAHIVFKLYNNRLPRIKTTCIGEKLFVGVIEKRLTMNFSTIVSYHTNKNTFVFFFFFYPDGHDYKISYMPHTEYRNIHIRIMSTLWLLWFFFFPFILNRGTNDI